MKNILPEYSSIQHLPFKPNNKGDSVAFESEANIIFKEERTFVEEKIDGASCAMAFVEGYPVVRSRSKILRKGMEMKTPSTKQFGMVWNWMYQHKNCFSILENYGQYSVYGEWMIQQHGCFYDEIPDWFIAYDLYDYEKGYYLNSLKSTKILTDCGFQVVPNLLYGKVPNYEFLEKLANEKSEYSTNLKREGIVVKVCDDDKIITKFKMVRQGFKQGCLLGKEINKNKLKETK